MWIERKCTKSIQLACNMSDISDFVQEIVPAYRCVHTPDKFPVHVYTDHEGDNHDRSLQAKKAKCQMVTVA